MIQHSIYCCQLSTTAVITYQGLILSRGIGAQVKKTVRRRNDFLPHTSDNAPMRGALRKERIPWRIEAELGWHWYTQETKAVMCSFMWIGIHCHIVTLTPWIKPFIKNVCCGKVWCSTCKKNHQMFNFSWKSGVTFTADLGGNLTYR